MSLSLLTNDTGCPDKKKLNHILFLDYGSLCKDHVRLSLIAKLNAQIHPMSNVHK